MNTVNGQLKPVLIDFLDFPGLEREDNPILGLLRRRFDVISSEYPDYVFFTHEGDRHRLYSCTKIFYTQERFAPNWRDCDFAITSTRFEDSRAYHLPYYALWRSPDALLRNPGTDWRSVLRAKTGFCSFLTGYDNRSVKTRSTFFTKLTARRRVDSAGRALNNMGWNVPPGIEPKLEFLKRYKFNIAFENSDVPGYTTEKIVDAFAACAVPVFWGDITVKTQFNPEAFIDRRDFTSDETCIEHILRVDQDDALYLRYLAASPFVGNRPNKEWDHERLLGFIEGIFNRRPDPVARRSWFWGLTNWRWVRRIKTHEEKGRPTAQDRHAGRTAVG